MNPRRAAAGHYSAVVSRADRGCDGVKHTRSSPLLSGLCTRGSRSSPSRRVSRRVPGCAWSSDEPALAVGGASCVDLDEYTKTTGALEAAVYKYIYTKSHITYIHDTRTHSHTHTRVTLTHHTAKSARRGSRVYSRSEGRRSPQHRTSRPHDSTVQPRLAHTSLLPPPLRQPRAPSLVQRRALPLRGGVRAPPPHPRTAQCG